MAVVALATAWAAGLQLSAPSAGGGTDAVRLGPSSGESVDGYVARVAPRPGPEPDGPRLALVQFAGGLDADAAVAATAGTEPLQAVFRVERPRVQTAVRRMPLTVLGDRGPADLAAAVRAAQTQAANQARAQTRAATGRSERIAALEADALAARCACVLALVVRGDPAALAATAARPGVRAVETAPPEARPEALAVSPLLPEQGPGTVVGPVPDDGPVR